MLTNVLDAPNVVEKEIGRLYAGGLVEVARSYGRSYGNEFEQRAAEKETRGCSNFR
jgi:hypothetical protein